MNLTTQTASILAIALATSLPACNKDGDSGEGEKAEKISGTSGKSAPAVQTLTEVLQGTDGPAPLGPFAGASFGMSAAELREASPAFADQGEYLSADDYGLTYSASLDRDTERFAGLRVTVSAADKGEIAAAWGEPVEQSYRDEPAAFWFDPDARVRAILTETIADENDERTLIIEPYLPVAAIIGEPDGPLGIETAGPLLGKTPDELKKAYPDAFDRALDSLAFMKWPGDDYGDAFKMELGLDEGVVTSLQFWLHHGDNEKTKAKILAQLESKYGEAKEARSALGTPVLELAAKPRVTLGETKGAWVVEIDAE